MQSFDCTIAFIVLTCVLTGAILCWCSPTPMTTESKIETLKTRIKAAEEAWRWCLANGHPAGAASREMHATLRELKSSMSLADEEFQQ